MKSNWKYESVKETFKKSKYTVLALALGLALGFAGGQAVQSSNEPSKESVRIPVRAETKSVEKETAEKGFGFSFMVDPWPRSFFHEPFYYNADPFSDTPVSFANEWRPTYLASAPVLDTSESANNVTVKAEVPGIEQKELDVVVTDNSVTIKGEKKRESGNSREGDFRVERFYGTFERSLTLPCRVESQKAEASLKNGVLTIVIPKNQLFQKESKKLTIKTQ